MTLLALSSDIGVHISTVLAVVNGLVDKHGIHVIVDRTTRVYYGTVDRYELVLTEFGEKAVREMFVGYIH